MVGLQEALWRCPMDHLSELPSQIHRILNTDVESLSTYGGMHVRRVAGQEHASVPIGRGLPGHIGKPGDIGGAAETIVRPVDSEECLADVAQGRLVALDDVRLIQHDARALTVLEFGHGIDALFTTADAPLRFFGRLDLGNQVAG